MNKLIINDVEYELEEHGISSGESIPSIVLDGKHYLGVAVVKPTESKWLMKTEDGVNIYEGDRVWYLDNELSLLYAPATLVIPVSYGYKYFSSKQTAVNFKLMNKPCLTVNDIKGWLERYFDYPNGINADELIEIVKEKINATT